MSTNEIKTVDDTMQVDGPPPSDEISSSSVTGPALQDVAAPDAAPDGEETPSSPLKPDTNDLPKKASPFGVPEISSNSLPVPKAEDSSEGESENEEAGESSEPGGDESNGLSRPSRNRRPPPKLPTAATRTMKTRGKKLNFQQVDFRRRYSSDEDERPPKKKKLTKKPAQIDNDESPSEESDEELEGDFLSSSVYLEYPWESLQLGNEIHGAGSAALNRFLRRKHIDPDKAPRLTPLQTLQMIQSLRVKTVLPPLKSDLHRVAFKDGDVPEPVDESKLNLPPSSSNAEPSKVPIAAASTKETPDEYTDFVSPNRAPLLDEMSELYEFMCEQDVDDGEVNRREALYFSERSLCDELRSLENEACQAKFEENKIMEKSKELGLIDSKKMTVVLTRGKIPV